MTKAKPEAKEPSSTSKRDLERAYDAGWEDALEIIKYIRNTDPPPPKPH